MSGGKWVVDPLTEYERDFATQREFLRARGWVQGKGHSWRHPLHGGQWYRWGAMKLQIAHDERTEYARDWLASR